MVITVKTIKGNLITLALAGKFDVIVHGCNCQCTMGKGIALAVRQLLPEAYAADCQTNKGDFTKLGTISTADIVRGETEFTVVNGYSQFDYLGKKRNADYRAIESVFRTVAQRYAGKRIAYPMIGAGLAGGDWSVIYPIICKELSGQDHTLVLFKP